MTNRAVFGVAAAAVLSAGAALVAGPGAAVADAAPGTNPFAGTYSGASPGVHLGYGLTTISKSGRVTGSFSGGVLYYGWDGRFSGNVDVAGRLTGRGTVTTTNSTPGTAPTSFKQTYTFDETLAPAGDGTSNLILTAADGSTYAWIKQ
jgi:hypothetical protein